MKSNDKGKSRLLDLKFRGRSIGCKKARKEGSKLSFGLLPYFIWGEQALCLCYLFISLNHIKGIFQLLLICNIPSDKLSVLRKKCCTNVS